MFIKIITDCLKCSGFGWLSYEKLEWQTTGGNWVKYNYKCNCCKGTGKIKYFSY